MANFTGKVVIVTGSSSGIGEATAIHFAKLGANVVVNSIDEQNATRVANICRSVSPIAAKISEIIADITVDDEAKHLIESTVGEFGQIDVLVNNAGAMYYTSVEANDFMDTYERTVRFNMRAAVYLTHLAVPYLESTKGNVVCISSIGAIIPIKYMMPYCMAKCALDMFVKCAAVELGPKGIRVNVLNLGTVKTNINKAAGVSDEDFSAICDRSAAQSPLGMIAKPEDIANSVAFLASDEASFITGTNVVVDAGLIYNFNFQK